MITGQYGKLYPLLVNTQTATDKHIKKKYILHQSLGLVTEVTASKSGKKKFKVVDVFDPTVEEIIVGEDNTFMDADGRWYYQSLEESVEEPTEESVEEPIESLAPIQEVAVFTPKATLEVSQDIPDTPEPTLEVSPSLQDATQAVTLSRGEFVAKWGIRLESIAYSEAYNKTKDQGFWTAPDGTTWTRTGDNKKAIWTKMPLVTV